MPAISVWNYKGGVSKTTSVSALGTCPRFQRRLMIDLDPQGDLAFITGAALLADYANKRGKLVNALCGRGPTADVLLRMPDGSWFCSGDDALERLPQTYPSGLGTPEEALRRLLDTTRDKFMTFVDLPPRASFLVRLGLTAADAVLIPAPLEVQAVSGVTRSVDFLRRELPTVRILGVVRVRVPPATTATKVVDDALATVCRQRGVTLLHSIVRERTAIQRAQIMHASIWTAPQTDAATDYGALADEISMLIKEV